MLSLTDCCGLIAARSRGVKHGQGWEAWLAPECFWYNRVRLYPDPPRDLQAAAAELAEAIRAGELPPLVSWLDGDFPGGALAEAAEKAGFVPVTAQRAMYLSLEGRQGAAEQPPQLRRMESREVTEWAETNARAFGKPPDTGGLRLLAERNGPDTEFLVWEADGKIAAGALLCCAAGNAGIHEVFTLPEYRRRGIAATVVGHALDRGAAMGCTCATLQASEMGYPLYRSLGFAEVGAVQNWIFKPD